ncbi:hypothetical protein RJT34_23768 [Clitoria ternatea]|uniref:Myb/SANT-like domain-containing protein n=1 Tax=Clitoria ternatea TaxID=43366 RepID=A0AAN9FLM0_CLITE
MGRFRVVDAFEKNVSTYHAAFVTMIVVLSVFDSSLQFLLSRFSLVDFDRRVLTARRRCSSPVIHLFATDRACRVAPQRKGIILMAPPKKDTAKWNDNKTEILLKICIEEIDAGNRPGTHFSKEGWKNIEKKFEERTGCAYDRIQLKNKQDNLKKDFQSFVKLVEKDTGLGWNHEKRTIEADEEWWAAKGKEDPEILKWKNGGPKFLDLLEKCFKGTIATGVSILIPYSDPPVYEETNVDGEDTPTHVENEFIEIEAENCQASNEEQPNAIPTQSNMNAKRKRAGKGAKKSGTADRLQHSLDRSVHDTRIFNDTLRKPNLRFPYPPEGKYYLVDSGYPSFKGFLGPYRNTRSDSHDLDILENMENINELQNEEQNFSGGDNHDIYDHEDWQEPTQTDVRYMEEVRNVIRDQLSRRGR